MASGQKRGEERGAPAGKTEDCLEALHNLGENPATPAARAAIGGYLAHKSNLVVARAAKLAGTAELHGLEPQLVEAFERFMKNPAATDKGCAAKTEIVRALEALGAAEAGVFLAGIRHVQMEGSYGPPIDTAAGLRAASAMGLVHMNHPDAMLENVTLLVDREDDARIGAVRALAASGRMEAAPLLRLKVLERDPSPEVIAECFAGLLAISPESSIEFVMRYLDSEDAALVETAAIALGECREATAIALLKSRWTGAGPVMRRALLTGMAVAREDAAFEFLYSVVETAIEKIAAEAVRALALYRHDNRIRQRVESIVRGRKGALLRQAFEAEFGRADS